MNLIQAGTGRVVITPPVGIYLIGMQRAEGSHAVHDDLNATALALSDGVTELVILSADILSFTPELVERVRQDASKLTGIPPQNMMFCATHCHSGPAPEADADRPALEQAYTAGLPYLLSGAIRMAHENLTPSVLGFGRGKARIGMNRRHTRPDGVTVIAANPDRPIDEDVEVLRVDAVDGRPLAVLVNHATHSVVLGNGSNVICRDWPGVMGDVVEQVTGGRCMFLQGAAGDINPWPGEPTDRMDIVRRLGTQIGGEVVKVWAGIEMQPAARLAALTTQVRLPLEPPSRYAGKMPPLVEWSAGGADSLKQFHKWMYDMGVRPQKTVGAGDEQAVMAEMQVFRIGEAGVVAFPAELFVKIAFAIKARSPLKQTLVAGYSDGCVGYIPMPEDYPFGGYEVSEAFYGYGLPSPIASQAAGLVEDTAVEMLEKLALPGGHP